jgi:MaoC like domain
LTRRSRLPSRRQGEATSPASRAAARLVRSELAYADPVARRRPRGPILELGSDEAKDKVQPRGLGRGLVILCIGGSRGFALALETNSQYWTLGAPMSQRYLEDFAVGQSFESGKVAVDQEQIETFAAEFDPQPFHLDEQAAQNTVFHGLAASGWHTATMTMRLLVESELRPAGGIVGAGFDEFRWPRSVRIDALRLGRLRSFDALPTERPPAPRRRTR